MISTSIGSPTPEGRVRPDNHRGFGEAARSGREVRLYRAHAYEPLDPALIVTDRSFKRWLDEQVRTLKANPGPKPFHEP
ncbi:MAG: hypothetical protein IPM55_21855 [Acidobacteria bacterium]|nr:hypothetical protein [Acidobacteriota bacterium]